VERKKEGVDDEPDDVGQDVGWVVKDIEILEQDVKWTQKSAKKHQ
jgi:hypothetical protein